MGLDYRVCSITLTGNCSDKNTHIFSAYNENIFKVLINTKMNDLFSSLTSKLSFPTLWGLFQFFYLLQLRTTNKYLYCTVFGSGTPEPIIKAWVCFMSRWCLQAELQAGMIIREFTKFTNSCQSDASLWSRTISMNLQEFGNLDRWKPVWWIPLK